MGFSGVISTISSGAVLDAVKWIGDLGPLLVLFAGVAVLGLALAALRGLL